MCCNFSESEYGVSMMYGNTPLPESWMKSTPTGFVFDNTGVHDELTTGHPAIPGLINLTVLQFWNYHNRKRGPELDQASLDAAIKYFKKAD